MRLYSSDMERPQAATGFGILNIAFGASGLLGLVASYMMLGAKGQIANPILEAMRSNATYVTWLKVLSPLTVVASSIAVVAGLGLLGMKPWGRTLSLAYAWWLVVSKTAGAIVAWLYLLPSLAEQAGKLTGHTVLALKIGGYAVAFGGILGLIYPVLMIYFMDRPAMKQAFAGGPNGVRLPSDAR